MNTRTQLGTLHSKDTGPHSRAWLDLQEERLQEETSKR